MMSSVKVDTRTLKDVVLSEKPFSDRPVGLDELRSQYSPIFSVEKRDANSFALCADGKFTMCAIEDRPLRHTKFTMLLPTVRMTRGHYPLKEVIEGSDEHSDVASVIAHLLGVDDANYGAVAGDLRCDTTTGDPVFKVATGHHGTNFVMFYSDKRPEFSGIVESRTVVQVGDSIWMVMLPFYLVVKNVF
jgi:hypothetical protein